MRVEQHKGRVTYHCDRCPRSMTFSGEKRQIITHATTSGWKCLHGVLKCTECIDRESINVARACAAIA